MKITSRMLRRIVIEEMNKIERQKLQEGSSKRPVRVTPEYINRLILEEYEAFQNRKRLAEARRRRQARIAESRRRRRNRR